MTGECCWPLRRLSNELLDEWWRRQTSTPDLRLLLGEVAGDEDGLVGLLLVLLLPDVDVGLLLRLLWRLLGAETTSADDEHILR